MSKQNSLPDFLKDLADGIRTAEGSTAPINPQDFRSRVEALPNSGGGGGGGESGVPIKVATLPTPTANTVGKVYLVDTKVTPEVGQVVGDKLYFDTSKNPLDYSLGSAIIMGETQEGVHCTYVDFFALQGITGMGHCYAIGVASADMSVFLGMPYVYCDMLTVEQFNTNVGASLGLSITEFGWQTDVVDTTSIKDRKITGVYEEYDFVKVKGGEYYVGTGDNTFRLGKPVGDKIYFDTTKNPTDYLAFIDQMMLELSNGTNSNFLAMMDYAPAMGLTDAHIYALFLSDETGGLLGLAYLDTANTLTLEQINEMLAPAFGMSLEKFGWQTDVLDTSAFADYVVTENNLALWDFLAYGNDWYDFEKIHGDVINELTTEVAEQEATIAEQEATIAEQEAIVNQHNQFLDGTINNLDLTGLKRIRDGLCSYTEKLLTLTNTDSVTYIGRYAFENCKALHDVAFPNVTLIDTAAFNNCGQLCAVEFPNATYIGVYAFAKCEALTRVNFPKVTSIAEHAFRECTELKAAVFPNVTSVGAYAFYYCKTLMAVVIGTNTTTVATLENTNALSSTPLEDDLCYIYVPDDLVDNYKSATNWSTYAHLIKGISEAPEWVLTEIAE